MLSYEEALDTLLAAARAPQATERVPLLAARGRILAADLISPLAVPPADNSAMDGYAVRCADLASGAILPVSQRVPAGSVPEPLHSGTAARIFTGAPIPPGADAVVMQERCEAGEGGVRVLEAPRPGENIRRAGEDIAPRAVVLAAGCRLAAAHLGLAASVGVAELEVFRRLRVAVFFTGDELLTPGEAPAPGKIFNSNRYVLRARLEALGCELIDLGIVPDDAATTRRALQDAAAQADLVMTCGGVSVGEEDHVKAAVEATGSLQTWKVAIRPGKPFALGRVGTAAFIGLPGNPVSSLVTFEALARPFVRASQGEGGVRPQPLRLRADFAVARPLQVREFLRVRRNALGGLDLFPAQGSAVLSACAWADGLVARAPGATIAAGDLVDYFPWGEEGGA